MPITGSKRSSNIWKQMREAAENPVHKSSARCGRALKTNLTEKHSYFSRCHHAATLDLSLWLRKLAGWHGYFASDCTVQSLAKSWITPSLFILCFQGARLSCNKVLNQSWAIVLEPFWSSFNGFLGTLRASFIRFHSSPCACPFSD